MSYGTGPAPYGDQAPYGGPAPYPGGPTPYGAPSQFGQFGPPPLTPDIAPQPGASFGEAVKRFFQRYAQFNGYASRSEYWWVALFNALVGLGIYVLLFMVVGLGGALGGSSDDVGTSIGIGAIIVMLLAFAYLSRAWPSRCGACTMWESLEHGGSFSSFRSASAPSGS